MLVYWAARVAVVDERDVGARTAPVKGHPQGVEDEIGAHVAGELPADDHPAVGVEHEGEEDESFPAAQVGEVGDPQLVRAGGHEVAPNEVRPPLRLWVGRRVVRHGFPRRFAPTIPLLFISRCTRQRGTCSPTRRRAFHIRR